MSNIKNNDDKQNDNLAFHAHIDNDKSEEIKPLLDRKRNNHENSFYDSFDTISNEDEDCSSINRSTRATFLQSTSSVTSRLSVLMTLQEKLSKDQRSTLLMTICNILPILQGSAVFGMPYAFIVGGFYFAPTFVFMCLLADITGILLVDCLYDISPRSKLKKRIYGDYSEVTYACWGNIGSNIVSSLNIGYFIANNIVNIVLLGKCVHDLLDGHINLNEKEITLIASLLLIPPLFIKKLSVMVYVSLCGVFAIFIGSITAMVTFIQYYDAWKTNAEAIPRFNIEGYPLAIGILMFSLMLNTMLPQIEGSMKNRNQITSAVHISYAISTVIKLSFGLLGALAFGLSTKQLVALNVSASSIYSKYILLVMLCAYAFANYALIFYVVFEKIDSFLSQKGIYNICIVLLTRVGLTLFCVPIAIYLPYFAIVSGIIGAVIGTLLVFTFPVYFHLYLKWKSLSFIRRSAEIVLLLLGLFTGVCATYSSVYSLYVAAKQS